MPKHAFVPLLLMLLGVASCATPASRPLASAPPAALVSPSAPANAPALQPRPVPVPAAPRPPLATEQPYFVQQGVASFYGKANQGKRTAGGEHFNRTDLTAAHRSLAFGTVVRVTNLRNGMMVKVRINDRGPRVKNRVIDLSSAAAGTLGLKDGLALVRVEAFASDQPGRRAD